MTGGSGAGDEGSRAISDRRFDVVLEEARRGACWACTQIYESLAPPVAGYLRAQGAAEPDDLASEVFLRVFSGCGSFSGSEAQFRSWVFAIAHSRLVDARRTRDRLPEVIVLEDERLDLRCPASAGAEEEVMDLLEREEVRELMEALTDDQSDVLALRVLGQLSVDEVAELLEKPPGAVRSLQHRGLATLRRKIVSETSGCRHTIKASEEPWPDDRNGEEGLPGGLAP